MKNQTKQSRARLTMRCLVWVLMLACSCRKEEGSRPNQPSPTEPEWVVYHSANSGLPDNQVNALAIDAQQVKWLGTAKGLVRIRGEEWTVYDTTNSPLPSSFIQALAVEGDGTVWIGTNRGLARYRTSDWTVYTSQNSLLPDNAITCLTHDGAHQRTWIGTARGLLRVNADGNWHLYDTMEDDLILSLATDRNGDLWLGTFNHYAFRGRLMKLASDQWTTFQLDQMGYPSTFPYALTLDRNDAVVAVLSGTSVKAVIRQGATGWQELGGPAEAGGLKAILAEGDTLWVGGNTLSIFGRSPSANLRLPGGQAGILAMALDGQGRKWLGTNQSGVAIYHRSGK